MDPNANPVLAEGPKNDAPIVRDAHSNPATFQGLGGPSSKAEPGEVQTTINPDTTIHPNASIQNPVTVDGGPAHGVKKQAPHPSVAARTDDQVKAMQDQAKANKTAALGASAKPGGVK